MDRHMIFLLLMVDIAIVIGPVLNPTGDVAVCEGSVAVFNCSFTNGTFPFFELNRTDVVMYKILNVTSSWSGTVLHLEVPGAPWSNDAIIKCVVSGIASEPAVLHVQVPPQLASTDICISCLSNDKMKMVVDVPSTGPQGSMYWVVVSRTDGTQLLSNITTSSVSVFTMEGCYQCLPCQVLVTPMCASDVGNGVMRMFNHSTVTPSTSTLSSAGPTYSSAPTDKTPESVAALVVPGIALLMIITITIIIIAILVCVKRRRTRAVQNAANTSSEQPLTAGTYVPHQDTMTSPERESRPLGEPHVQYQRDSESLSFNPPLTSPACNPTAPFQGTKDEEPPQPHDQKITNFTYLQPTSNGSQIPPNSVVVMVTSSGNRQAQ